MPDLSGAKGRPYVGSMIERDIATADRAPFFSRFSKLHSGALVTLRVGATDEVVDQPFRGISEDGPDLIVHTGGGTNQPHLGHRVAHASRIALEQTDEGADAAVAIVSRDGTRTELRFRWPLSADLLDPAVE
jgi:hypothetical protein